MIRAVAIAVTIVVASIYSCLMSYLLGYFWTCGRLWSMQVYGNRYVAGMSKKQNEKVEG